MKGKFNNWLVVLLIIAMIMGVNVTVWAEDDNTNFTKPTTSVLNEEEPISTAQNTENKDVITKTVPNDEVEDTDVSQDKNNESQNKNTEIVAKIGDKSYDSLVAAIKAATEGDTIVLQKTIEGQTGIDIRTPVLIDLNGYSIIFKENSSTDRNYFNIIGGMLTLTGKGTVQEADNGAYYAPVMLQPSTDDVAHYSVITIGKEVTLKGWSGIFINQIGIEETYGVVVQMDGTIQTVKDTDGYNGHGIYINGVNQATKGNVHQITVGETANITSEGNGIYAAGYADWHLSGNITGSDALSIKSGTFIIDGGTYHSTGDFSDPAAANSNGSENTGAALSITSNKSYAPKTEVTVTGGSFISDNGYALYEGIAKYQDGTPVADVSFAKMSINAGNFEGNSEKGTVSINTMADKKVISGGVFNSSVDSSFMSEGYTLPSQPDSQGQYVVKEMQVARIGDITYNTLQSAFDAVGTDGTETTITLLEDIETTRINSITEGKNIVLDMNGKTISVPHEFEGRPIENSGTLKVKGNGIIDSSMADNGYGAINNFGNLTIENGTYRGKLEASGAAIYNRPGGTLIINDGTFEKATCAVCNAGDAVINGGQFLGESCSGCNQNAWSYTVKSVKIDEETTPSLIINNGYVKGTQGALAGAVGYLEVNGGTFETVICKNKHKNACFYALYGAGEYGEVNVVINGGVFKTEGEHTAALIGNDNPGGDGGINAPATAYIHGGTFIAPENVPAIIGAEKTGDPQIDGGSFSSAVNTQYLVPGYAAQQQSDGTFGISYIFDNPGADGSKTNPFQIATIEQLRAFRDSVNAGTTYEGQYIELTANVDLNVITDCIMSKWIPIGDGIRNGSGIGENSTPFKGTFDGKGHTVGNLVYMNTNIGKDNVIGLFGILDGGTVNDLTVEAAISDSVCTNVGAVCGLMVNNSTISNCTVEGEITGADGVGGVVGRMTISGTISGCYNEADVNVKETGGGIVGKAYYTETNQAMIISGCTNNGIIVSDTYHAGGIAGFSAAGIERCTNNGLITADNSAGGIVGEQTNAGYIRNSTNTAEVSGKQNAGGIVGWVRYQNNPTSYSKTERIVLSGNTNTGNVLCTADSPTPATLGYGGIAGTIYNSALVESNVNQADKIGGEYATFAAGIAGNLQVENNNAFPEDPGERKGTVTIKNNVSFTGIDSITGTCKDLYAYNNNPDLFIVDSDNTPTYKVAKVGDKEYTSLQDAINAAGSDTTKTVTLLMDVTSGELSVREKGIIINLNGKTLTGKDTEYLIDLAADNSQLTNGTIELQQKNGILINSAAVLDELTIQCYGEYGINGNNKDYVYPVRVQSGTLTMTNTTIKDDGENYGAAGVVIYPKTSDENLTTATAILGKGVNINTLYLGVTGNGTAHGTNIILKDDASITTGKEGTAVYHPQIGTLTIQDNVTITGGNTGVEIRSGNLKVTGNPTITGGDGELKAIPNGNGTTSDNCAIAVAQHTTKKPINVKIEGGTLIGTAALNEANPESNPQEAIDQIAFTVTDGTFKGLVQSEDKKHFISGGVFDRLPNTDLVAESYQPIASTDGKTYSVYAVVEEDTKQGIRVIEMPLKNYTVEAGPTLEDYAFAGWYKEVACTTPVSDKDTTDSVFAKFVAIDELIQFQGGSLRKDYEDANKTSLRFGYYIEAPEGAKDVSWGWSYYNDKTTTPKEIPGEASVPFDKGAFSNLVIKNISAENYNVNLYAQLYMNYTTADGTKVSIVEDGSENGYQMRSVQHVADLIVNSPFASESDKTYAKDILSKIPVNTNLLKFFK